MRGCHSRTDASQYATLAQIFGGVLPFLAADMGVVALIVAFPAAVLYLPSMI